MQKYLAILVACLMLITGSAVNAQTFPKLTGRVVDQANLLSPADEAALTVKLTALETQSQRQFVVATIPDLQGYDIADYGYRLGRAWAIGDKARNDGVVMIVAPNERKVRIENGYGLEGIMTDALSNQIVRRDILPQFKAGNYPAGITAGVDKVIAQLQLPPDQAAKIAAQAGKHRKSKSGGVNIGTVIFWLFVFFFFILPALRSMSRGERRHSRDGYGGPVVIWGGGDSFGGGGSSWGGGGFGGGGFGGGGGSFGGGGASGDW